MSPSPLVVLLHAVALGGFIRLGKGNRLVVEGISEVILAGFVVVIVVLVLGGNRLIRVTRRSRTL